MLINSQGFLKHLSCQEKTRIRREKMIQFRFFEFRGEFLQNLHFLIFSVA